MRVTPILLSLLTAATNVQGEYSKVKTYQLANGTWLENIAGYGISWYIKLTRADRPILYEVDTAHQHGGPSAVHTFPDAKGLSGIAELGYESYAILALTQVNGEDATSLWTYSSNGTEKAVKVIEKVGDAHSLNGLTPLSPNVVLASDTFAGVVYRIDIRARTAKVVLSDPTMANGINGVRYRKPYLYYTNSVQGLFARIAIDPVTAEPTAEAEIIAQGPLLVGADDFALAHWSDDAFVANFVENSLVRVNTTQKAAEVVASDIPAPCSAGFGSSGGLIVVTSGTGGDGGASVWSVAVPDERWA